MTTHVTGTRLAESRVHRATGTQPPPGSTVAQAQSAADKEANFKQAVDSVAPKMQHEPEHITREDASLLHSADRRAHGTVEKGGVLRYLIFAAHPIHHTSMTESFPSSDCADRDCLRWGYLPGSASRFSEQGRHQVLRLGTTFWPSCFLYD